MTTPTPPPDWYPDPESPRSGRYRWWDGHKWTTDTHTPSEPPGTAEAPGIDPTSSVAPPPVATKEKNSRKIWYLIGALCAVALVVVVAVAVSVAASDKGANKTNRASSGAAQSTTVDPAEQSREAAAAQSAQREMEQQRAADLDKSTYQATDSRGWQLVAKNPDSHVGEKYVIYGHVTQADAAMGSSTIRADTDGAQVDYYEMNINTIAKAGAATFVDIVEDDLVTMWIVVKGSKTYDTTVGGSVTAPEVEVNIIETTGSSK
ncbi:DUF2510 domain-containing protein [Gordonia sp. w5E2]|uniref:DUF2510 domain-containing protein n=2 Tax=Gordonia TaxID=2053 RepID=A0ABR5IGX1_9ACTN|nr:MULTISPECIES: DUF2510 domain-containing protein [Gordonia]KNA92856.1 hypothetical protein ABW18_04450 [Gordonia jacobaea]OBC06367.1 hypothetical protein A5785_11170 [Gordonia sp. 852002-50395_SCH5434458]OBC09527.1 hypothetical protein A5786_06735 [Gordonia sp. 852002-50816_SCH5313054-a]OBC13355.1 hypothetical protein A5788_19855 [Gordonia sp. 852002-50816_SCH5313054-c]